MIGRIKQYEVSLTNYVEIFLVQWLNHREQVKQPNIWPIWKEEK